MVNGRGCGGAVFENEEGGSDSSEPTNNGRKDYGDADLNMRLKSGS